MDFIGKISSGKKREDCFGWSLTRLQPRFNFGSCEWELQQRALRAIHQNGRHDKSRKRDWKRCDTFASEGPFVFHCRAIADPLNGLHAKCRTASNPLGFAVSPDTKVSRNHTKTQYGSKPRKSVDTIIPLAIMAKSENAPKIEDRREPSQKANREAALKRVREENVGHM